MYNGAEIFEIINLDSFQCADNRDSNNVLRSHP